MCAAAVHTDHNPLPPPSPRTVAAVRRFLFKKRLQGLTPAQILQQQVDARIGAAVAEATRQSQMLQNRAEAVREGTTSWIEQATALQPTEAAEMRIPSLQSTLENAQETHEELQSNVSTAQQKLATQKQIKAELLNSLAHGTEQIKKLTIPFNGESQLIAIGEQVCQHISK